MDTSIDILIVEDSEQSGRLFELILSTLGYQIRLARTGTEALQLLVDQGCRPSLILLDMQLPKLSGLDVIREIRKLPELAAVRVLALTAHAMPGDRERFESAGCDAYMSKPVDTRKFANRVAAEFKKAQEKHAKMKGNRL